jgi:hypothetical protein
MALERSTVLSSQQWISTKNPTAISPKDEEFQEWVTKPVDNHRPMRDIVINAILDLSIVNLIGWFQLPEWIRFAIALVQNKSDWIEVVVYFIAINLNSLGLCGLLLMPPRGFYKQSRGFCICIQMISDRPRMLLHLQVQRIQVISIKTNNTLHQKLDLRFYRFEIKSAWKYTDMYIYCGLRNSYEPISRNGAREKKCFY